MSPRRPPPQPIRISRRQGRTEASTNHAAIPTTNHAAIPTFTRRLPKEGPQAATNMFSGSSPASPVDSLTAHAAHGSPAQYRSRPPSGKILVAVAVDVQPPTPEVIEPSSRRRSAEAAAALRALKKCRRTASVYSSSSSNGTLEIAATQVGRQGGVYLRPDLSGKSNLTFDQLPRTVSLEDLVVREPGNEEETLASSTIAAENVDQRSEPLIRATPPSNLPIRSSYLSRSSSLVPLTGQHIPPPRYQSRSTPPSRPSHPSPLSARSRRNETEAERFKRLYLCPWEGSSPKSSLPCGRREDPPAQEEHLEKCLPFHVGRDVEVQETRSLSERRKRLALKVGLELLIAALFADLIALNVRVWSLRDAYYDE